MSHLPCGRGVWAAVAVGLAAMLAGDVRAAASLDTALTEKVRAEMPKVIAWRRLIHANPELSNQEAETSALVARELTRMGLDVRTGIAHHGVIGILKGGLPGGVVALRADMDALPVEEKTGLPFASTKRGVYNGHATPIAHSCGHDAHTAMLLGAAEVLSSVRTKIPGTIVFIFQPAEEDHPDNDGGAKLMIKEGVLANPAPSAIFGLHVQPGEPGRLYYGSGGVMASSDSVNLVLTGRQTHGATPWAGIDTVTMGSQVVEALNAISARQLDPSAGPNVITVGVFQAGERANIIPESIRLGATVRTLDPKIRVEALHRVDRTIRDIAASWGATATFEPDEEPYPVTSNDPKLVAEMLPSLMKAAAGFGVAPRAPSTASEDFSFYQEQIPGFYLFLGISPDGTSIADTPPNHSPYFTVNERALISGVRAHVFLALDYLSRSEVRSGAAVRPPARTSRQVG